jgi:hypothetical protein
VSHADRAGSRSYHYAPASEYVRLLFIDGEGLATTLRARKNLRAVATAAGDGHATRPTARGGHAALAHPAHDARDLPLWCERCFHAVRERGS